jgi:hypothetical protein
LLLPLVSGSWVLVSATQARAAGAASVSEAFFDSEVGDFLGQGQSGTGVSSPNNVTIEGDTGGYPTFDAGGWTISFAAPVGETLVPETYEGAQRTQSRTAGAPGLDVSGNGRSCTTEDGRFIVDDATYDASGDLVSFAARFEDHCNGAVAALFGDVLWNSTANFWERNVSPDALNFTTDPTQTVTITNYGPASDTPQSFTVTGPSAAEFALTADTCTGLLSAGTACQVVVTYTPDISDPTPSASLWFNDSLAPLGSPGEAAGAGQGRFIALSASLSQ